MFAIERPPSLDKDAPKPKPSNRAIEVAEPEAMPEVDQPAIAWLGVFGDAADETLATQLGVDGGVVLLVVAEDSPAAKAGLQTHDLLTSIDGKQISSQEDVRELVMARQPGDEIRMKIVSRGVQSEKTVKLGERPAGLMPIPQDPRLRDPEDVLPGARLPDLRRQLEQLDQMIPDNGDLQKQIEEQIDRLEKHLKKLEDLPGFRMEMQLDKMLNDLPKQKKRFELNLQSMGSVELLDEKGSVKMKMRDGNREVEVRDKAGELLYEGPWDTEQDKAAVDPEIRERIEKLDVDGKGMRFNFKQVPGLDFEFNREDADEPDDLEPEEDGALEERPAPEIQGDDDELD